MATPDGFSLISTGTALGFLPLAVVQNMRLRSDTLATPMPAGQREGAAGELSSERLDLLVAGDSTAVGGCCEHMDAALPPRLAYHVAMRLHRRVHWQALGGAGWTAAHLDTALRREGVPPADVAVVLLGTNDVMALTSLSTWRRQLLRIVDRFFDSGVRLVAISGVPAVDMLPGMAWPLGPLLGVRSRQLDRVARSLARPTPLAPERSIQYVPVPEVVPSAHLSSDGLHPSASGYAHWASRIAEAVVREYIVLPREPERHRALHAGRQG